jgi:hypothetical protein
MRFSGFVQVFFRQADVLQQGRRVDIVIPKCDDRPSRRKSGCRRQEVGIPFVGHLLAPLQSEESLTGNWVLN